MKITIEYEGHRAVVEDDVIVDITDAIALMEQALAGVGYNAEHLKGAFLYKAKEIQKELGEI